MAVVEAACGHCGSSAPLELKGTVKYEQRTEYHEGHGEVDWSRNIAVWVCPACEKPTLGRFTYLDAFDERGAETTLYPTPRDNSALPPKVAQRLDAALKVRSADPSFFAVGIRRMLETVCDTEGAKGHNLFEKLDALASQDKIPSTLSEAAHQLRELGNLGAHDLDAEVEEADVAQIEGLANAILEYMYRAPAQVEAVRQGIEERKASG